MTTHFFEANSWFQEITSLCVTANFCVIKILVKVVLLCEFVEEGGGKKDTKKMAKYDITL